MGGVSIFSQNFNMTLHKRERLSPPCKRLRSTRSDRCRRAGPELSRDDESDERRSQRLLYHPHG